FALAVCLGGGPDHSGQPPSGWSAQGYQCFGGDRHGRRYHHHAGDFRLPAVRSRRRWPRPRRFHRDRHPAHVHGPHGAIGLPPLPRPVPPACSPSGLNHPAQTRGIRSKRRIMTNSTVISMLIGISVVVIVGGLGLVMSRSSDALAEERLAGLTGQKKNRTAKKADPARGILARPAPLAPA